MENFQYLHSCFFQGGGDYYQASLENAKDICNQAELSECVCMFMSTHA